MPNIETVFVADRSSIFKITTPQGFLPYGEGLEVASSDVVLRAFKHGYYVQQTHAEETSSLKQIIPFFVIQHKKKFLQLRYRSEHVFSLGTGIHMREFYEKEPLCGLWSSGRIFLPELRRKIFFDEQAIQHISYIGVLNQDSTFVEAPHLGVVYLITMKTPSFEVVASKISKTSWVSWSQISSKHLFRPWSQLLLQHDLGNL